MSLMPIDFCGISSQPYRLFRYSTVLLTTAPLLCLSTVFLHIQNCLLAKKDEKLPLARHVVRALQHFHFVKHFITIVFMRAQKVVIGHPESQVVVGAFDAVKPVRFAVGSLVSTV